MQSGSVSRGTLTGHHSLVMPCSTSAGFAVRASGATTPIPRTDESSSRVNRPGQAMCSKTHPGRCRLMSAEKRQGHGTFFFAV